MSTPQDLSQPAQTPSETGIYEGNFGLSPDSHTAQKLRHASPEHLHITSRRTFIGPIPRSWLQTHRKSWYKKWFGLKNYSSRPATFSADTSFNQINQRQLAGFIDVPNEGVYRPSFPQPEDVFDEEPVETTPIAPIDTSQEEPTPAAQQQNHLSQTEVESEQDGGLDNTATPLDLPHSGMRTSSTDHVTMEEYFTPSESLRGRSRSGLCESVDTQIRPLEISNTNQDVRHRSNAVDDSTPTQLDEPFLSLSMQESAPGTDRTESTASLIPHKGPTPAKFISKESSTRLQAEVSQAETAAGREEDTDQPPTDQRILSNAASGMVRFQQDGSTTVEMQRREESRKPQTRERARGRRPRILPGRDGEIIRAERMLVRIDTTQMQSLPNDFSENNSIKIETRISEKWREYLVVCRQGADEETPITLQLYKTRVIPQVQVSQVKRSSSHEIPLTLGFTKVNLFSSLDKTIVLWHPDHYGTILFIMRAKSAAHSMEWYTFLRTTLGWQRPTNLIVHVPDLDIAVLLKHPFSHLQNDRIQTDQDDDSGCTTLLRTMAEERVVAAGIVKTCMDTLLECPEWTSILKIWPGSEKMGLAWRRYDRLEWVHGANEERMYGTIAMRSSHELELRPKRHYPTSIKRKGEEELVEEPPPIEGFLILLTSQRGKRQRLGKAYSRRLYFNVQNQYLCFCRPGRASPPPPPRLPTIVGSNIPSASQLSKSAPMIYSIDPYPLRDGEISWLSGTGRRCRDQHDAEAYRESRRNLENLERAEGYFNLCRVREVRVANQHHFPEESHVNGGDVDFHDEARDTTVRDGSAQHHQSQANRSFELVMNDGLVVKFRAYDMQTRDEWVQRISDLVRYWTVRTREDVAIMKSVRRRNLEHLNITEDQEFMFGQFAQTWEVSKAQASPELFNICGISGCRAVKMSGNLYCKPRRRSTFTACSVILTESQILTFQSLIRTFFGEETPHTHHEREWVLDLRDCYIYSGLITSSDLLYQNHTIDINLPSRHAAPRLYVTDGWTSSDEDVATCFVLWQNARKTVFRSQEDQGEAGVRTKWKKVSTLGVPGRSIVFKTRSRAERDMWVLAIETEIDRLQQLEDVRIVSKD